MLNGGPFFNAFSLVTVVSLARKAQQQSGYTQQWGPGCRGAPRCGSGVARHRVQALPRPRSAAPPSPAAWRGRGDARPLALPTTYAARQALTEHAVILPLRSIAHAARVRDRWRGGHALRRALLARSRLARKPARRRRVCDVRARLRERTSMSLPTKRGDDARAGRRGLASRESGAARRAGGQGRRALRARVEGDGAMRPPGSR